MLRFLPILALTLCGSTTSDAETLAGPVPAVVERVVDGDTIAVSARVWPGHNVHVLVRVRGIDAPEPRGRCEAETRRAAHAARLVAESVAAGRVTLTGIEGDKYYGRVVADIRLEDGRDLGSVILAAGLARAYEGGARRSWCPGRENGVRRLAPAS